MVYLYVNYFLISAQILTFSVQARYLFLQARGTKLIFFCIMHQNCRTGLGSKRRHNIGKDDTRPSRNRKLKGELIFREEGQEYAQVTKMLGNCWLEAKCADGKKRLCHIRGNMRRKIWVARGDIILVGLRDFQDSRADVIHKYLPNEARNLKSYGELSVSFKIYETEIFVEEHDGQVEFLDLRDFWNFVGSKEDEINERIFGIKYLKHRNWLVTIE